MQIDIRCIKCGEDLEVTLKSNTILVEPCDICMEESFDNGESEGYDNGHEDGVEEGKSET